MKETHKKIYGFLGLGVVAAMTCCAALIPAPETQAISSSVTEIVTVRVTSAVADVVVTGVNNNEISFSPEKDITVEYFGVNDVQVVLTYTDLDGNEHEIMSDNIISDYVDGAKTYHFNALDYTSISSTGDGYGRYTLTVRGNGPDGARDEETVSFEYLPIYGDVTKDNDNKYYLDIYSNNGEPTIPIDQESTTATVKIYNKETGEEVPFSPIVTGLPADRMELPFSEYNLPEGIYVVEITATNENGDVLGAPYVFEMNYTTGSVVPGGDEEGDSEGDSAGSIVAVPDTGGLFHGGGISKTDYIITGLIILAIVSIGSAIWIVKHDKKKAPVKIRRRK